MIWSFLLLGFLLLNVFVCLKNLDRHCVIFRAA